MTPDERELQDEYEPEPYSDGHEESYEEESHVDETTS
jgi:hypothetical protein